MTVMEIILLIFGLLIFAASFILPERKGSLAQSELKLGEKAVKELVEKEMESVKSRIDDMVDETIIYASEKTERACERLSNEKIMAINEYSDTVLEAINHNHKEVMFLYDMLTDKQTSVKMTMQKIEQTAKEISKTVIEMNDTVKEAESAVDTPIMQKIDDKGVQADKSDTVWANTNQTNVNHANTNQFNTNQLNTNQLNTNQTNLNHNNMNQTNTNQLNTNPNNTNQTNLNQMNTNQMNTNQADMNQTNTNQTNTNQTNTNRASAEQIDVMQESVEEKPAKKAVRKKTVKTASTASSTASAADVNIQFEAGNDSKKNNNERILSLHKQGKSNMIIAKELGLGVGEVKLVIDLFKGM